MLDYNKNEEEKLFEEKTGKAMKTIKMVLFGVFGIIGLILMVIGIVLYTLINEDPTVKIPSLILFFMGLFYMVLAIILKKLLPEKLNYDRYKKTISREGGINLYEQQVEIKMLKERIDNLEEKVKNLENHRYY